MSSALRLAAAAGVALTLVIFGAVAGVTYQQSFDECVSGTTLHVDQTPDADSGYSAEEIRLFSSLSPIEQRIFLEAFTDERNASSVYENWTTAWFDDVEVVEYRGKQFEVMIAVVDCGSSSGLLPSRETLRA